MKIWTNLCKFVADVFKKPGYKTPMNQLITHFKQHGTTASDSQLKGWDRKFHPQVSNHRLITDLRFCNYEIISPGFIVHLTVIYPYKILNPAYKGIHINFIFTPVNDLKCFKYNNFAPRNPNAQLSLITALN